MAETPTRRVLGEVSANTPVVFKTGKDEAGFGNRQVDRSKRLEKMLQETEQRQEREKTGAGEKRGRERLGVELKGSPTKKARLSGIGHGNSEKGHEGREIIKSVMVRVCLSMFCRIDAGSF
jgi:hypothetical protein